MVSKELLVKLQDFWSEYKRYKIGVVGIVLLVFLLVLTIAAPFIANPEHVKNWNVAEYWADYPAEAPPEWINWFSPVKRAVQERITNYTIHEDVHEAINVKIVEVYFTYDYEYDIPPKDLVIKATLQFNATTPPLYSLRVIRPDGNEIRLITQKKLEVSGANITTYDMRIALTKIEDINTRLINGIEKWLEEKYEEVPEWFEEEREKVEVTMIDPMLVLFSNASEGILSGTGSPLKGNYTLALRVVFRCVNDTITPTELLVKGSVYGLCGTDGSGRDLWSGIVFGTQWALIIGLLTSVLSTFIGVLVGVTSGYLGGLWDELIQRITQIFYSMPVLPLLILMAYLWKRSIWNVIILLVIFGWSGVAIVTRSMALQLKEALYVEAAKATGASSARIIFKYIMPQVLPYAFATIALNVPSAILTEAGLSFLGLSDPTIVTWGRILEDANGGGAVMKNLWWWVIPPGLMIALVGMTFVFIGNALDAVLNPKLKSR